MESEERRLDQLRIHPIERHKSSKIVMPATRDGDVEEQADDDADRQQGPVRLSSSSTSSSRVWPEMTLTRWKWTRRRDGADTSAKHPGGGDRMHADEASWGLIAEKHGEEDHTGDRRDKPSAPAAQGCLAR